MGIFQHNFKYLRKHIFNESLQDFAKRLGQPHGKLIPYEYDGNPKMDFLVLLAEKCEINLHVFLTVELNKENEKSVLLSTNYIKQSSDAEYKKLMETLNELVNEPDIETREKLADSIQQVIKRRQAAYEELKRRFMEFGKKMSDITRRIF